MRTKAVVFRAILGALAVCAGVAAAIPVRAGDLSTCVTPQEAVAFNLRHLQSRLMVAGLACNQRDAYNNFVEAFRLPLAGAGADLIGYFRRSGGGQTALNRHVTELANVAGLYRAGDPEGFCAATWSVFLRLAEAPAELEAHAVAHILLEAGAPAPCAESSAAVQTVDGK